MPVGDGCVAVVNEVEVVVVTFNVRPPELLRSLTFLPAAAWHPVDVNSFI